MYQIKSLAKGRSWYYLTGWACIDLIVLADFLSQTRGWKDAWFSASGSWRSNDTNANDPVPTSFQIPICCFTFVIFIIFLINFNFIIVIWRSPSVLSAEMFGDNVLQLDMISLFNRTSHQEFSLIPVSKWRV